jgi:hypothetical protein
MKIPFHIKLSRKEAMRVAIPVTALALVASVVVGRERPAGPIVEPVRQADTRIRVSEDLDLTNMFRNQNEDSSPAIDPFARRSFAPQQQAAQSPAAPEKPTAPPLPFRYVGKAIEDGKLAVFLQRGEDSYSVSKGQKLDNEYRVDKVSETKILFTYLPLKQKQTLDIPAVN